MKCATIYYFFHSSLLTVYKFILLDLRRPFSFQLELLSLYFML